MNTLHACVDAAQFREALSNVLRFLACRTLFCYFLDEYRSNQMDKECGNPCNYALKNNNAKRPSPSKLPADCGYSCYTRRIQQREDKEYKGCEWSKE